MEAIQRSANHWPSILLNIGNELICQAGFACCIDAVERDTQWMRKLRRDEKTRELLKKLFPSHNDFLSTFRVQAVRALLLATKNGPSDISVPRLTSTNSTGKLISS